MGENHIKTSLYYWSLNAGTLLGFSLAITRAAGPKQAFSLL